MVQLLEDVNWSLIAPLMVISLVLIIIALWDCIRSEHTNGPKWMWILIIVFVNTVGPVLYFVFGRRQQ